ncbi:hypothetical protein [Klebsiella phage Kpn6N]|nr:hypothetical protein [Klebsiella phage Kpn6N]
MKVYVVVKNNWNCEYGYEEYSLPLKIFHTKSEATSYAEELEANDSYYQYLVEEYDVM